MFRHLDVALGRVLRLDEELRENSFLNQDQLAERFDVSRRTIQRDFEFLRQHGAPIKYDARRRGFGYADPGFRLSFFKLSAQELVAVFLAQRLLELYGSTPFAEGIAGLFQRCLPLLSGEVHVDPEELRSCLAVRLAPVPPADAALFERISRATTERRRLRLLYWTAERDDLTQRDVDPYALVCSQGSSQGDWFLIGWCHTRKDVRTFAVHRIRDAEELDETFDKPAAFDAGTYLSRAFAKVRGDGELQTVRLRFSAHAARWIRERTWHPMQELEALPDKGVRLTVRLGSFLEIKAFALSWGEHCEVEEPSELRAEIREELRRMQQRYAAGAAVPAEERRRRFAPSGKAARARRKDA